MDEGENEVHRPSRVAVQRKRYRDRQQQEQSEVPKHQLGEGLDLEEGALILTLALAQEPPIS